MDAGQIDCRPGGDGFALALRIGSRLNHIRLIRAALRSVLMHLGVVEGESEFLALAVAEIMTNSIEHGLKGDDSRDLQLCMTLRGNEVEFTVEDDAPPLPEEERLRLIGEAVAMEDPSDQWPMRGHGLQIVHNIVDSVSVTREQGKNCILLKKAVQLQSESESERPS